MAVRVPSEIDRLNILSKHHRRSRLPGKFLRDVYAMTKRVLHGTHFILHPAGVLPLGVELNLAVVQDADLAEVEVLLKEWLHHVRDMDHAAATRFGFPVPDLDFDVYVNAEGGHEGQSSYVHIEIACPCIMYWVRDTKMDIPNRPGDEPEDAELRERELSRRLWEVSCDQD